ncbi:MAG: hypothetical protein ACXWZS_05405 [Gemmatirosa sp.]
MRTILLLDGRTCVLHGTGIRDYAGGDLPAGESRPEIVEYLVRGLSGRCTLPGDWATRDGDALRDLVEEAARHSLSGAVPPFDGPRGDAIRDLVIRAAEMPAAQLRALADADVGRHTDRATIRWLVDADPGRAHAARRLPRYLEEAARVVLAHDAPRDGELGGDRPTPRQVAAAIGSAATALLVCERPKAHGHSTLAHAYHALVTPFQE